MKLWAPEHKDIKLSKHVQRRFTEMVNRLEGKKYEKWMMSFGLFSLEKRLRGDFSMGNSFFMRRSRREGSGFSGDQ